MRLVLIPGYRSLFGNPEKSYEDWAQSLSSKAIISIAIGLNNELDATASNEQIQDRLRTIFGMRQPKAQLDKIEAAYRSFKRKVGKAYQEDVFGRRYLLAMILKELERNIENELEDTTPDQEYDFLMAYLMIVDEVNDKDDPIMEIVRQHKGDEDYKYRLMWTTQIHQYQFNEHSILPFEVYKLICFVKYTLDNYRPYLKEYLQKNGFTNPGQLIGSLVSVAQAGLIENSNGLLKKSATIYPTAGLDATHLNNMCIKPETGRNPAFSTVDLKTHPLFKRGNNEYAIIDFNQFFKKLYRGPFFELIKQTSLAQKIKFNEYSSIISKNVLEEICFTSIIKELRINNSDLIHFDEGDMDGLPDCYYRRNGAAFLFEFKASILPDKILEDSDFEGIKNYIDERLVNNKKGHAKGIGQLTRMISDFKELKYTFDERYSHRHLKKALVVYPIICVDEFYFSMPGVNHYLNELFLPQIEALNEDKFRIQPLTIIGLSDLYELVLNGGNIDSLQTLIDRYWKILKKREEENKGNEMRIALSVSSFTEIFGTIFLKELQGNRQKSNGEVKAFKMVKITKRELEDNL